MALKPKTTAQVSALLAHCNQRRLAVVPQGGNTGLVGGSVPVFDEVVLNTSNMNAILEINEAAGVATVQAGVVLEALDNALAEHGMCVPLDLGAKGSCQLGALSSAGDRCLALLTSAFRGQRVDQRWWPPPASLRLAARLCARLGGRAG